MEVGLICFGLVKRWDGAEMMVCSCPCVGLGSNLTRLQLQLQQNVKPIEYLLILALRKRVLMTEYALERVEGFPE